jgi:hypothetical protein
MRWMLRPGHGSLECGVMSLSRNLVWFSLFVGCITKKWHNEPKETVQWSLNVVELQVAWTFYTIQTSRYSNLHSSHRWNIFYTTYLSQVLHVTLLTEVCLFSFFCPFVLSLFRLFLSFVNCLFPIFLYFHTAGLFLSFPLFFLFPPSFTSPLSLCFFQQLSLYFPVSHQILLSTLIDSTHRNHYPIVRSFF